ncbi:DUF2461 domain-containing protein [Belliella kenyensis]|uniref:DUF2461 domain-containing protein n=1 Tax=Belliella kenyensis TaxID=1472724 RepID=A0ABV8ESQ9_9BACT|nr:DUF2461 domain-containing protein [Belliella kenyensis]MCH7402900.1 DUF2461 domain-containing protein [Belliella kenyensis]MDN3602606.1 DUF2461 domain-containing protein [Belliella kenyensis]
MSRQYLEFLKDLSENNTKEWMDENRALYLSVKDGFIQEVNEMLEEIKVLEPGMANLRPKDCVFRQNRDIRFSQNKAPYKTNLAAYFAVGGKKSEGPGYYLHIQPGSSFIAGGVWMPSAEVLKKIRQEIDYSGNLLVDILENPDFKSWFSGIEGDQLKTSPRDYDSDHPYIDLLRFKSFIVSTPLSDKEIKSGEFKEKTLSVFKVMKPFHDFLHQAIEDVESGDGLL